MARGLVLLNDKENWDLADGDYKLNLTNGSLVLHFSKHRQELLGAYLVTSFKSAISATDDSMKNFCSFVNLKTGCLQFNERCSRDTTLSRVLSHLSPGDFKGEKAIQKGEFVELYSRNNFDINLLYDAEKNVGWKS